MGYRPPKGVRPPQLEGRRTGRPRGSKNLASALRDAQWAYENRFKARAAPPTAGARLWWEFAYFYPDELEDFLDEFDRR